MGLLSYEDRYGKGVTGDQAVQAVQAAIANGTISVGSDGGGVTTADVQAAVAAGKTQPYLGPYRGQPVTAGSLVTHGGHTYAANTDVPAQLPYVAAAEAHVLAAGAAVPIPAGAAVNDVLVWMAAFNSGSDFPPTLSGTLSRVGSAESAWQNDDPHYWTEFLVHKLASGDITAGSLSTGIAAASVGIAYLLRAPAGKNLNAPSQGASGGNANLSPQFSGFGASSNIYLAATRQTGASITATAAGLQAVTTATGNGFTLCAYLANSDDGTDASLFPTAALEITSVVKTASYVATFPTASFDQIA